MFFRRFKDAPLWEGNTMRAYWFVPLLLLPMASTAVASNADPSVQIIQLAEPPYEDGDMEFWARKQGAYADARHLARLGHVKSQYNFAMMAHIRGETDRAVYWYERAARRNHELAAFNLASMYMDGEGVERDLATAAKWIERSARSGYAPAQFQLGKMYYHGQGVPKDPEMEAYWYRQAAENGHPAAQHNLAVLYHKGEGVEQNDELARHWLEKSREGGDLEKRY